MLDSTTANVARMKEYLGSVLIPELTDNEAREIDEAGSQVHNRVVVSLATLYCHCRLTRPPQCPWIDQLPN